MNITKLVLATLPLAFVWGIAGCGDPGEPEDASSDNGQSRDVIEDTASDSTTDTNDTVRPPDTFDEVGMDAMPDATPDGWSDATPDTTLDVLSDAIPDTPPDAIHDAADALPDPGATDLDAIGDAPDSLQDGHEPTDLENDDVGDADTGVCIPSCDAKECGDDGCGGSCGECDEHFVCEASQCNYVPYCGDGTCDKTASYTETCDSCLDDCGCGCGETCSGGTCSFTACDGIECGDDGCGGRCDSCGPWEACGLDDVCASTIDIAWATAPTGSFWMGCVVGDRECNGDEYPRHMVILNGFRIMDAEVTEDQYFQVMGSLPGGITTPPAQAGLPVVEVSWTEARNFCQQLGGRLPTEAEWEYVARADSITTYSCGADASCLDDIAWYDFNSGVGGILTRHQIRQRLWNHWRLYDMNGNVEEWVNDWFDANYYNQSPLADPAGPESGTMKCIRGGGYDAPTQVLRSSHRGYDDPSYTSESRGFRCVMDL